MKKVIIFDMDGVLVDSGQIAKDSLNSSYTGLTAEMHQQLLSGNFHEELQKLAHLKKPETEEERNLRHINYTEAKSNAPLFAGIKDLLKELHESGYTIVLNTSAFERNCLPILEKNGITNYFDYIAAAEVSKSKVEKFKMIEDRYAAQKEDVLFVTDTLGDVKEADIAHVPTLAVTWGAQHRSVFEHAAYSNLIGIVDTVEELSDVIRKS